MEEQNRPPATPDMGQSKSSTSLSGMKSSSPARKIRRDRSGSASRRIVVAKDKDGGASSMSSKPPLKGKESPIKKGLEATYEMSKNEMIQIIDSQKRENRYLQEKIKYLENEKNQMVDNFKLSSGVLLERLKDLEHIKSQFEQMKHLPQGVNLGSTAILKSYLDPSERPQTAQVLSKIEASNKPGRIGSAAEQLPKNPSTAASSNLQDPYSSRGFGELGSTKKGNPKSQQIGNDSDDEREDMQDSDDPNEIMTCPNCKEEMTFKEAPAHTIQCYRNSTKCKICGEIILKEKKKEHLARWRNLEELKIALKNDHEEHVSMHFDHGMGINMEMNEDGVKTENPLTASVTSLSKIPPPDSMNQNRDNWVPMHYAAENGSLNCILSMVSRGAGIDPTDNFGRTPLMIAIENNKSAVARSLIELGADIENTDVYGKTPLMYACKIGSFEIVEQLITCKADTKTVNKVGDSAITMAKKSGNQEIMMLLVKSGASITGRPSSRSRPLPIKK